MDLKNKKKKLNIVSEKKKSNKRIWIFFIIFGILIVGGVYLYYYLGFGSSGGIPITLTKENFPGFLKQHKVVKDLPVDADIELNIGDTVISIEGNDVTIGENENAEIVIDADDSLIDELNEQGLSAIKEGIEDGSINIKTDKSIKELTKKYAKAIAKNLGTFT